MVTARTIFARMRSAALPMLVARLLVGGAYVWYGTHKVLEPIAFLKALHGYAMLPTSPPQVLNLTVVVLPWIEILCGMLLLVGALVRAASLLLFVMTVVFTVVVSLRAETLAASQSVPLCSVYFDCGCGMGEVWFCGKFAENLGLIALAAVAAMSRSRRWSLEALFTAPADRPESSPLPSR
jgi:uncharacterized membrane protein YphA (DoxX/SURF4 family)